MPRSLLWGIITGKYKSSRDFGGDPDLPLGWPLNRAGYETWGDIKKRRNENQNRRRERRGGGRNEHLDELEEEDEEEHRSRHRERRHGGRREHRHNPGHRSRRQEYEQAEAQSHFRGGHDEKDRVYQQQQRREADFDRTKMRKKVSFNDRARPWDGAH